MHLVTHGHFHHKDGGHTSQSATAENLMLHTNFTALCFTESQTS